MSHDLDFDHEHEVPSAADQAAIARLIWEQDTLELRTVGIDIGSPGALPELRRRAEDHCGDPGAAGDREDPHPPAVAGAGAAPCAGPRSSAAGGLTIPPPHCSSGPARRAAGVGCVPVATGPMETAWRQGVNRRQCPERRFLVWPSTPNRLQPASKDRFERFGRCVPPLCCRVRGAVGEEKGRLKSLSTRVFTRAPQLDAIHADFRDVSDRAVDSHVKNLRRKLQAVLSGTECIATVYGAGYRLDLPPASAGDGGP